MGDKYPLSHKQACDLIGKSYKNILERSEDKIQLKAVYVEYVGTRAVYWRYKGSVWAQGAWFDKYKILCGASYWRYRLVGSEG